MTPEQLAAKLASNPDLRQANAAPAPLGRSQSFFVPGPLPGLNEIIAAAKVGGRGKAYSDMKRTAGDVVKTSIIWLNMHRMGRVSVTCTWSEPNRRRDPDNIFAGVKFILDGLVDSGILAGDGWRHIAGIQHKLTIDKDHPGVWVELQEAQP